MAAINQKPDNRFKTRKRHLRKRLIYQILFIVVAMGSIAFFIFYILEKEYRDTFAVSYTERSTKESVQKYQNFILPLVRTLTVAQGWGKSGLVNINNNQDVSLKFIPLIKQMPQVEALFIGDEKDRYFELRKQRGGWIQYAGKQENGILKFNGHRMDSSLQILDRFSDETEYKPSDYRWYQSGVEAFQEGQISWTRPNTSRTGEITNIFASTAWEKDSLITVLAFQLRLPGFIELMSIIEESDDERTFLFDREFALYNNPDTSSIREMRSSEEFVLHAGVKDTVIKSFLTALNQVGFLIDGPKKIIIGGEAWRGSYLPLYRNEGVLKVGCLINEKTIFENFTIRKSIVYLIFAVGFLLALLMIYILFRRYTRKMDTLLYRRINPERIARELPNIISQGEGATIEFKSTMRMNLKTGKFGREIEQAWLKAVAAYLNSDGGLLLIGVNDDGVILGLESDGFENDDRCRLHFKNVFNQHIGSELSRYVHMDIYEQDGKKVVIVECDSSPEPAFLKGNNADEDFYIRSGPSSMKLSVSKSLKYIRAREAEKENQ